MSRKKNQEIAIKMLFKNMELNASVTAGNGVSRENRKTVEQILSLR